MKRQRQTVTTCVYAYGCLPPTAGWTAAQEEWARQRTLWDVLVDLDDAHDARVWTAAAAHDAEIARAQTTMQAHTDRLDALITERRARRQQARGAVPTPELDAAIEAEAAARRTVRHGLFARLKAWRTDHAEEAQALERQRRAANAEARRRSDLYWANYNRVLDDFERARMTTRKLGRRVRRTDPSVDRGILTVQIQRTVSGLGASPRELEDGTYLQLQLQREATGRHATLLLRVNADGLRLACPVLLHRPLPPDSRVKRAQFTWFRDGHRKRYQLALTVTRPAADPAVHPGTSAIGLDLGWRLQDDGALLVATGYDSRGTIHRWTRDARWMTSMDTAEDPDGIGRDDDRERAACLNRRAWLIRQRREQYRLLAVELCDRYAVIGIEQWNLARTARVKQTETSEPVLPAPARSQRVRAALSVLRQAIRLRAAKTGAQIVEITGPSTCQCADCGHVQTPADRAELVWTCPGCRRAWDQDVNAAKNLLAAATGASGPVMAVATA
ncbi:MAG: transposase [Patescibacteria group bacterium]|nr:transposase [Patescibacteria group bacterium]